MQKQTNEKPFLVKLYTSLKFWGGLLLFFFLIFFTNIFTRGKLVSEMADVAMALSHNAHLATFIFYYLPLPGFGINPSPLLYMFPILVCLAELTGIAWLKFKASTLKNRTTIIIGTIILLLLVTQFVVFILIMFRLSDSPSFP